MLIIKQRDLDGKSRATVGAVLFRASQCSTRRHLEGFHLREPPSLTSVPFQLIQAPVPHFGELLTLGVERMHFMHLSFLIFTFAIPPTLTLSSFYSTFGTNDCVQDRPQLVNCSHLTCVQTLGCHEGSRGGSGDCLSVQ